MAKTSYSIAEIAKRLGASRATVARLIDSGELPAINIGTGKHRIFRILDDDLSHFIEARRQKPVPKTPTKISGGLQESDARVSPHDEVARPVGRFWQKAINGD